MLDDIFAAEIEGYSPDRSTLPFEEHGIDSFDLVSLRVAVEQRIGRPIPDPAWSSFLSPADILAYGDGTSAPSADAASTGSAHIADYVIGMPQMAVAGLSESWLFKEIGDQHWNLITAGLGKPSSELVDGNNNRLYATFTRLRLTGTHSLRMFRENERLAMSGAISRYGAGIFLGSYAFEAGSRRITVDVASSFARRGTADSNDGLQKGQPDIPDDCPIPLLTDKPAFIQEYQAARREPPRPALFERDYAINPYHDINGVGLLYFAAYPMISDTCELDLVGRGNHWALESSTIARDILYFANSDIDQTLHYAVHDRRQGDDSFHASATISRAGTAMARIDTRKHIDA